MTSNTCCHKGNIFLSMVFAIAAFIGAYVLSVNDVNWRNSICTVDKHMPTMYEPKDLKCFSNSAIFHGDQVKCTKVKNDSWEWTIKDFSLGKQNFLKIGLGT